MVDFSSVYDGTQKVGDLSAHVTPADLLETTQAQLDACAALLRDLSDSDLAFIPSDTQSEDGTGWSIPHVIAHMTASSEEGVAISSILARGVEYPAGLRLRTEVDWPLLGSVASCLQRIEESRRIQLGYLQAWPDTPNLDLCRPLPPEFAARVGDLNAIGCVLLGLMHGDGHCKQLEAIAAQLPPRS